MNTLQRVARLIIEVAFDTSIATIALFNDMARYRGRVDDLRRLERGTLGKAISEILDARGLTLVPGYESHDLKHALLGYGMTPEDEVRMQAFMIGNRNYSLRSFLIFGFGAVLLPELWPTLRTDFDNGRRARPISTWTIESYSERDMAELRAGLSR